MSRFCSFLALIVAAVLANATGARAQTTTDAALYAALLQADAIDRTYDALVQPALTGLLREAEIPEPVDVNRPPQPARLSVLIIDGKKLAGVRTENAGVQRLLPRVADNVLAIPPATIVFDKSVIAALLVSAFNDQLGMLQGVEAAKALGAGASPEAMHAAAATFGAVSDFLRYRSIRNERENFDPSQSNGALAPVIMQAMSGTKGIDVGRMLPMFTMMLAPIVLHEIGHLRRSVAGTYEQALGSALAAATLSLIRQEENAADDFAVERMRLVVKKKYVERRGNYPILAMELQSAISTVKHMRDQVMVDTFTGFRGLNAEDLLVEIEHRDCNERKGLDQASFNNPDKIRSASYGRLPLLTRAEFDDARSRIQRRIANGTHSHHFTRGDRFLAVIESEAQMGPFTMLAQPLAFLDAAIQNEPARLSPPAGTMGTGLSLDDLNRGLAGEVQPAVNCPEGLCAVIRFKDLPFFIEAIGPPNDLRRARITFPLFGPNAARLDENPQEYTMYQLLSVRLVANALGDRTFDGGKVSERAAQASPALQLVTQIRRMSLKCGAGSVGKSIGKRSVSIRTLNEKNWVTIDVQPLPPPPPQGGAPKGNRK
jgi:hypothetical protein